VGTGGRGQRGGHEVGEQADAHGSEEIDRRFESVRQTEQTGAPPAFVHLPGPPATSWRQWRTSSRIPTIQQLLDHGLRQMQQRVKTLHTSLSLMRSMKITHLRRIVHESVVQCVAIEKHIKRERKRERERERDREGRPAHIHVQIHVIDGN
jgi:hypothetical protein